MALNSFEEITTKYKFDVKTTTYKTVVSKTGISQLLKVDIWIPDKAQPSEGFPVILYLHGGGLVTGHRAFSPLINAWFPGFAKGHNAVVVSPDYRLLPESTGQDIVEDVMDVWSWMTDTHTSSLQSFLGAIKINLSHVLVSGGSAGAFGATHLALSHSKPSEAKPYIKAMLLQYPLVHVDSPWTTQGHPNHNPKSSNKDVTVFGLPPMSEAEFWKLDEEVKRNRDDMVIVSEGGFERTGLYVSGLYYGRWQSWVCDGLKAIDEGTSRDPVAFRRIERETDAQFPQRVFVAHGTADTAVPVEHGIEFVHLVQKRFPDSESRIEVFAGGEHGFDSEHDIINSDRLQSNLSWAAEAWLAP